MDPCRKVLSRRARTMDQRPPGRCGWNDGVRLGETGVDGPEQAGRCTASLAKAAGQVEGVARMVKSKRYCVDVLHRSQPARKLSRGRASTRKYLERRVTDAIASGRSAHPRRSDASHRPTPLTTP